MRRWILAAAALLALSGGAEAQRADPPHAWVFGSWTGGIFPPGEASGPRCTGQPTVIFTRDVVLRASVFDVPYRQRLIETVATGPDVLEFRFVPAAGPSGPLASRMPPDIGFGCPGGPNTLRVERRGDEIVFPDCAEFPSPLKRCVGN
ncbi:hypothetical protein [Falsiroseomonas selenitidurans]|uniref:Uncharacterized protein n=1 Tax=Falsiroseomonas selenitidurans TaxID=2716335 RepID=A0ABX1E430_9PROT|nr:hypothetical protein [Falsiroseomonas selenitidurans]NKC31758.1 hypothetical protein [Falsiroseomonas selenitidurans]